jgi:hypothetical protein
MPELSGWLRILQVTMVTKVALGFPKEGRKHVGFRAKCKVQSTRYCYYQILLTKIGMCGIILVKLHNVKFRENPFGRSRVATCGQTDTAKLIGAFL